MTESDVNLPPVTRDEYNHLMRLLGAPSEIGTRSLGEGLTGDGVNNLRTKFENLEKTNADA